MTKLIIIIGSLILFTSCGVYYPALKNIPLTENKNELQLDCGFTIPNYDATISYGLTNNITASIYASPINAKNFQGSIGYYNKMESNWITEYNLGYNYGQDGITSHQTLAPRYRPHLNSKYNVYFFQFNIGKRHLQFLNMDFGLGLKTGLYDGVLEEYNSYTNKQSNDTSGSIKKYRDYCSLVEPSIFARFGWKKFKFNLKYTTAWLYRLTNNCPELPYWWFGNIGISINYTFGKKE